MTFTYRGCDTKSLQKNKDVFRRVVRLATTLWRSAMSQKCNSKQQVYPSYLFIYFKKPKDHICSLHPELRVEEMDIDGCI